MAPSGPKPKALTATSRLRRVVDPVAGSMRWGPMAGDSPVADRAPPGPGATGFTPWPTVASVRLFSPGRRTPISPRWKALQKMVPSGVMARSSGFPPTPWSGPNRPTMVPVAASATTSSLPSRLAIHSRPSRWTMPLSEPGGRWLSCRHSVAAHGEDAGTGTGAASGPHRAGGGVVQAVAAARASTAVIVPVHRRRRRWARGTGQDVRIMVPSSIGGTGRTGATDDHHRYGGGADE